MVVVGEASADRHGARVLEALRRRVPDVEAFGVGGEALRRAGLRCHADSGELEIVGFTAVVAHLPQLLRLHRRLSALLREARPDVLLCIDLPDFNALLARRARRLGVPVLFYVAPQVWAWRSGRAARWRERVSRLVVTLPFEPPFWQRAGVPVSYHGHPLLEDRSPRFAGREQALTRLGLDPARRTLVLAPGSRRSEWRHHARPLFAAAARVVRELPGLQLAVPLAPRIGEAEVQRAAARAGVAVRCTRPPHHDLFLHADLGLLCSGSVTLEAALAGLPMVVFYRGSWANALLARLLLETDRVALPNLLLGGERPVFPELLQHRASARRLAHEALRLLRDDDARAALRDAARRAAAALGSGTPSAAVADALLELAARPARSEPEASGAREQGRRPRSEPEASGARKETR
jgi:lipid-A-disaccharide synthase